jgi:hypothetical protein
MIIQRLRGVSVSRSPPPCLPLHRVFAHRAFPVPLVNLLAGWGEDCDEAWVRGTTSDTAISRRPRTREA